MTVAIVRTDHSAADLRREAGRTHDGPQARRLLAVAMVMDGASRKVAAQSCGMDRQSLRDWVHRYNAEGIAGLCNRRLTGRRPLLTAAQKAQVAALVEAGPVLGVDGVGRWRRVDLRDLIAERFGVAMHERTVGKLLRALGFRRLSVRPRHPGADAAAQEAFKKTSPNG